MPVLVSWFDAARMDSNVDPTQPAPTRRAGSLRGAGRRSFLAGALRTLAGLATLPALERAARAAPPAPSAADPRTPPDEAYLGAWLARSDARRARALAREVDAALPGWLRLAGGERRLRAARRRFLDPARLARDLDAGRVLVVDGWVLARSEVAVAAYAHAQAAGSPRA